MRRVEAIYDLGPQNADALKKYSLFFDRLRLLRLLGSDEPVDERLKADLRFLDSADFAKFVNSGYLHVARLSKALDDPDVQEALVRAYDPDREDYFCETSLGSDFFVRFLTFSVNHYEPELDCVPIYRSAISSISRGESYEKKSVLEVAMEQFPVPGETCAWQDILDFKQEMSDKQWHFRRFLSTLASKRQTAAEVRDDLEWTLNEYRKAMKIHKLKSSDSFIEVYLIPLVELGEDLAKFNWSKIAKGALSVKKRQVELMEAEMKAPGRECAYVFEAQKRFGSKGMQS
jgi:hypothetical protein